jgi:hypothetical protein
MARTIVWISWMFAIVGAGLLGGAGYWTSRVADFERRAACAEGTVVELVRSGSGNTYSPRVRYRTYSGAERTYQSSVSSSPPRFAVGDRVDVLFDPGNPADVRIRSFLDLWFGPTLLGGLGSIFGAIGAGMLLVRWASGRRAAELRLRGRRVLAKLQSIERNTSLAVNGAHPWRIVCQWIDPATGMLHLFKSENLWFDPTPHVHAGELTVFVDPRNPRRYVVDVSFLPRLAA